MLLDINVPLCLLDTFNPTSNGGMQNGSSALSEYVYTLRTCFCTFDTHLHAQSVFINKLSASELSRKFIESVLLVGHKNTLLQ